MGVIARVYGTALLPGVSKNRRLYTPEVVRRAVERAQARIADPDGMPLTMRTHHAADDDSTRLVGRVTNMTLAADGAARFEAVLADTPDGRSVASLAEPHDGKPVLKGVSIRGFWVGGVRDQDHQGETVTTGDDLELDGLDFTATPGVPGAGVDRVERVGESAAETRGRVCESVEDARVETTSEAGVGAGARYGDVPYADPGYQKDGQKRYPVDTKAHAKSAWSYISQAENARQYTAKQLKRVKERIVKALKGFGVTVAPQEGWLIDRVAAVTETLAECWDMERPGGLYMSLTNGPITVTVTAELIDPHDLDAVGRAAMAGAVQALTVIDPDLDADIDVDGAEPEDTDGDAGSGQPGSAETTTPTPEAAETAPAVPGPDPAPTPGDDTTDTSEDEEAAVSEPTNEAAETTPVAAPAAPVTLSGEQFAQLLAAFAPKPTPPVESAPPVAPVVEAAPVAETVEQRVARLVAEGLAAAKAELVESVQAQARRQPPPRRGLVGRVADDSAAESGDGLNEHGLPASWPNKPLHKYTAEERSLMSAALMDHVVGDRIR